MEMTYADIFSELKRRFMEADVSDIQEHLAYQFNIIGEAEGIYYVEVKDGKLYVEPYEYFDRDLIINTDFETAIDLANGDIEMSDAYAEEKITVWGNLDKAIEIYETIFEKDRR